MVDKRKSVSKCPYWCRRNRVPTTPDLLLPYLPGPEPFVSPPMSSVQTMPVYSTSRSSSSLDNASPFITGYAPSTDSIVPPDSSLIPSNYGPSYTESGVVFQWGWQHSLSFNHKQISMDLQGPAPPTWLLSSLIPWFPLVEIPVLTFRGSIKTSGCQIIH